MNFSEKEKTIINSIQKSVPLCEEPFTKLASLHKTTNKEIIDFLTYLKKEKCIRNIAGIFNNHTLGYHSSLVAFKILPEYLQSATELINSHPGVSHNYLRDHAFNLWFTLTVDSREVLRKTVEYFKEHTHALDSLILESEKTYKIGVQLSMTEKKREIPKENTTVSAASSIQNKVTNMAITEEVKTVVRILQEDLPLVENPFLKLCQKYNSFSEERLITLGKELLEQNILRRYAAIVGHRKIGYTYNAMVVWKPVNEAELSKAVHLAQAYTNISHIYKRTVYKDTWEYPLYTMIHATDQSDFNAIISSIYENAKIEEYTILPTLEEFKKKRTKLFSPHFDQWYEEHEI